MSLANTLDEIRTVMRGLPEIKRVYDDVPDALNEFPALVVADMGADCRPMSHGTEDAASLSMAHTIRVEVHIPFKDGAQAISQMNEIAPRVAAEIYRGFWSDRFKETMVTAGDNKLGTGSQSLFNYTVGPSEWAGQKTLAMIGDFLVTTVVEVLP